MVNRRDLKSWMARAIGSFRPAPKSSLSVLTYHSVGGGASGSLASTGFAAHMQAIAGLADTQVLDWRRKHEKCTDRLCLITFDDGYLDNFTEAAPILAHHGLKALFFVTTGFVEGSLDITRTFQSYKGLAPMNWDQVGRLLEQGHAIGLHGHTHRDFGKMNEAEAAEEFAISAEIFRRRLGQPADSFAYPFGQFQHRRRDLARLTAGTGLRYIFTTDHRLASPADLVPDEGLVLIPRLRVDAGDSPALVLQKMRGSWDYVAAVQRLQACASLVSLSPLLEHKH